MALPKSVDFDKVAYRVLTDAGDAIRSWLEGYPHEEVAFMNHLTGKLSKRHRGCDVGVSSPVTMNCNLYTLHRKGLAATDKYGADLAITVAIPEEGFLKTALFQVKRSREFSLTVEGSQLHDAHLDPRTRDRSFVLAVDETRAAFRVRSTMKLTEQFQGKQRTLEADAADWYCLTDFLRLWLSCKLGVASEHDDPDSIENLLKAFAVKGPFDNNSWGEYPQDMLPARSWLDYELVPKRP